MKCLLRKSTVIIIILLFIGTSIIPATSGIHLLSEKQKSSLNDLIFDSKIRFLMKRAHIPSLSACIIKNDSVVWSEGYGFYDLRNRKRASDDTIYMIGSITKTIIATAIMQLYEQGEFGLDDDINKFLNFSIRNPKHPDIPITFRMLLAQQSSSGLPDNIGFSRAELTLLHFRQMKYFLNSVPPEETYPWLKEELAYTENWADCPPGDKYIYSNMNYIILGHLVEQIANQSLEEYCKDNVFIPLNMTDTSFQINDLDRNRLAVPYIHLPVRLPGCYIPLPHYEKRCFKAAGGILTTVEDLSHFLIVHMNGGVYKDVRILNESTVELMHTVQYPGSNYGLGWLVQGMLGETGGHGGTIYGFIAGMLTRSSDNIGIIFFYNEWYPPLFSMSSFSLIEQLVQYAILQALFQKAEEL